MKVISIDFETYYDKESGYSIREMGTHNYTHDARFDPYLVSVSDGTDTWAGPPAHFNFAALDGAKLVSHNASFDRAVYHRMTEIGLAPNVNFREWDCTANLSAYLCNRRSLLHAANWLLGVEVSKEVRDYADGKHWEDIVKAGRAEDMLAYARADAHNCWSLWNNYGESWPQHERELSRLTIFQCARGVRVDFPQLQAQLLVAQTSLLIAEAALPWIFAGRKPTSPKAIAEECRKVGIPTPPVKSRDGEDAFDEWAANYAPQHIWIKGYCDYRILKKYIGTLETIRSRLHVEGDEHIMPFDMLYFGAHTGRWSGSGGYNVQNMRKESLKFNDTGWLIPGDELKKEVKDTLDVRSLILPRLGKRMIVCDLAQIEPRILAWITGDKAKLAAMAAGQSAYEAHARACMGWTGGDLKKENPELYLLAKIQVLGLGYGCGWERFIDIAADYTIDITKDDPEFIPVLDVDGHPMFDADDKPMVVPGYGQRSKQIVNTFRTDNPLIPELWKKLDDGFRGSEGGDFEMVLPSGRKLRYPQVRRERKAVEDPDDPKKIVLRWQYTALTFDGKRNLVCRKAFYGGLLCENLIQAIARDIFGEHLLDLHREPGIDVLFHVHDEAVVEVDDFVTPDDVARVMSRTPAWLAGCPVAAEAHEVPHYKK